VWWNGRNDLIAWSGFPDTLAVWVSAMEGDERTRTRFLYDEEVRRINAVSGSIPEGAIVAVVTQGDDHYLQRLQRTGWHFPRADNGAHTERHLSSGEAIERLEQIREQGASYLIVPGSSFSEARTAGWLADLERRYACVWNDDTCRMYYLTPPGG
jgi:hypothetical protein